MERRRARGLLDTLADAKDSVGEVLDALELFNSIGDDPAADVEPDPNPDPPEEP